MLQLVQRVEREFCTPPEGEGEEEEGGLPVDLQVSARCAVPCCACCAVSCRAVPFHALFKHLHRPTDLPDQQAVEATHKL